MASSRRPYLIRAIYDWACDNAQTPHLLVDADYNGCHVPPGFVGEDRRITLNVGMSATSGLALEDDGIRFSARFGGRPFPCEVPWGAVLAIYGRESGEGIVFGETEPPEGGDAPQPEEPDDKPEPPKGSHLRVVK